MEGSCMTRWRVAPRCAVCHGCAAGWRAIPEGRQTGVPVELPPSIIRTEKGADFVTPNFMVAPARLGRWVGESDAG
jgi:hypothetical protein